MLKLLSVFALSFALAAVGGCDAGIAGSSGASPSGASPSGATTECSKSRCETQAAARASGGTVGDAVAAPANPNCPSGGACDPTDCPKPECDATEECDEAQFECPSQKKDCAPAAPKANE